MTYVLVFSGTFSNIFKISYVRYCNTSCVSTAYALVCAGTLSIIHKIDYMCH